MMTIDKFYSQFKGDESDINWINGHREKWMSDDQWLCYLFLHRLFEGFHHIPCHPKANGTGIQIIFKSGGLATFDYDRLTKLVIMAHNWGVRAGVEGGNAGKIKLELFKRNVRDGRMYERHPTIEQAIEKYKDY